MRNLLMATAGLSFILALPAAAQTMHSPSNASDTKGPTHAALNRDTITNDLKGAGFTDIKVMPESFLVRATDKDGHPVMMAISPNSFEEMTRLGTSASSGAGNQKDQDSSQTQTH